MDECDMSNRLLPCMSLLLFVISCGPKLEELLSTEIEMLGRDVETATNLVG